MTPTLVDVPNHYQHVASASRPFITTDNASENRFASNPITPTIPATLDFLKNPWLRRASYSIGCTEDARLNLDPDPPKWNVIQRCYREVFRFIHTNHGINRAAIIARMSRFRCWI